MRSRRECHSHFVATIGFPSRQSEYMCFPSLLEVSKQKAAEKLTTRLGVHFVI